MIIINCCVLPCHPFTTTDSTSGRLTRSPTTSSYSNTTHGLVTIETKHTDVTTGQQDISARSTAISSIYPGYTKAIAKDVQGSASMHLIASETTAPREYSPKSDETPTTIPLILNGQTSSNTTMTIVIAVAVGVVTVLVLTVVVLLILFRRRKPQQSHNIARAKAECAVQPTTANVVYYKI